MNSTDETGKDLTLRCATEDDLIQIVGLLADDVLGAGRETKGAAVTDDYRTAFAAIQDNPRAAVMVAEQHGRIVACAQLDLIPNLSLRGALRGQIEGVRVASELRGQGVGRWFIDQLVTRCRAEGCRLVQLTTNATRKEALEFYESCEFEPTHVGFKLYL